MVRVLQREGFENLLTAGRVDVDLRNQSAVRDWFEQKRPNVAIVVAGTVGGILDNDTRRAEFLYDNLMIAANVIDSAYQAGTERLLYLGSSCIYPREAPQPMTESALLGGYLEPTNEPYAIAKIAGIKLCETYRHQYRSDFISAMPTNLYGPYDNFHPTRSHVIPGLMRRFHEAKAAGADKVVVWGSGSPQREFLHVDDLADACLFLLRNYDGAGHVNVGTGSDVTIRRVAELLRDIIEPGLELVFDDSKPDGAPRKLLDVSTLHGLGWRHTIELESGLRTTYEWFTENLRIALSSD
jgi:GDP-L-fucose synthase